MNIKKSNPTELKGHVKITSVKAKYQEEHFTAVQNERVEIVMKYNIQITSGNSLHVKWLVRKM